MSDMPPRCAVPSSRRITSRSGAVRLLDERGSERRTAARRSSLGRARRFAARAATGGRPDTRDRFADYVASLLAHRSPVPLPSRSPIRRARVSKHPESVTACDAPSSRRFWTRDRTFCLSFPDIPRIRPLVDERVSVASSPDRRHKPAGSEHVRLRGGSRAQQRCGAKESSSTSAGCRRAGTPRDLHGRRVRPALRRRVPQRQRTLLLDVVPEPRQDGGVPPATRRCGLSRVAPRRRWRR